MHSAAIAGCSVAGPAEQGRRGTADTISRLTVTGLPPPLPPSSASPGHCGCAAAPGSDVLDMQIRIAKTTSRTAQIAHHISHATGYRVLAEQVDGAD